MNKRKIGDIWKDEKDWMVQFPKGKMAFKTKKLAMVWRNSLVKEYGGK